MAGPWDKYAAQADSGGDTSAPAGPWQKYGAAPADNSPGLFDGAVKNTIDSLPIIGGGIGGAIGGVLGGAAATPADMAIGPLGTATGAIYGGVKGAAVGGYLGTAAKNAINYFYDPDKAPKTIADNVIDSAKGGAEQAMYQAGGEFAAPYIAKGVGAVVDAGKGAAQWAGTKLLSNLGGVSPDVIKEYAQRSAEINAAPSIDALKEVSDKFVGNLASDVDAKKVTVDQAQKALDGFQSDLKDAYKTAGYDARDAVTSAQQYLKDAHGTRITDLSQDVGDTVKQLKDEVTKGSAESFDILAKSGESIPVAPIKRNLTMEINGLKIGGKAPIGADEIAATNQLQSIRDTLDQFPKDLPADEAKKMLQQLQRSTNYNKGNGEFSAAADSALKNVNASLNGSLKTKIPEYAAKMDSVAPNTKLLAGLTDAGFGDRQTTAGLLKRMGAPEMADRAALLDQLGKKYNVDFLNAAKPESLPEYGKLQSAQGALEAIRPDKVANKIEQTVGASRQQSQLGDAQSQLASTQEKLAPFKSLAPNAAGQTTAQSKLQQLAGGKGNSIELGDMFQRLGKLTDTDFTQALKDQNVQAAFQKGATNGSRNAVRGVAAGAGIGYFIGGVPGATAGGAVGANLGGIVDQWGPAITKKVLDGVIQVSKSPTVETIQGLSVPDAVKSALTARLANYAASSAPAVGEDKWAQQGASKLGIQDPSRFMNDPKLKQLLIKASDLTPGSMAMKQIQDQLRNRGNK
jgi:hypothetical protein